MKSSILTLLVNLTFVALVFSQSTQNSSTESTKAPTAPPATSQTGGSSTTDSPTTASTSTANIPTSTLSPKDECPKHNGSCDECISAASYKCLFCYSDEGNACLEYPAGDVLPNHVCPLSKARWGVCWVNFEALIITMSVIGGLIILTVTICCIRCCCCRGGGNKAYLKDEAKWERQKTERKQRSEERKADRKERMDEIRRKYGIEFKGLVKDDTPYQRFDA